MKKVQIEIKRFGSTYSAVLIRRNSDGSGTGHRFIGRAGSLDGLSVDRTQELSLEDLEELQREIKASIKFLKAK